MHPNPGKVSATFVDFSERTNFLDKVLDRDPAFWRAELRDMREAGIRDVVIARAVVLGRAHYHSAFFEEWLEQDTVAAVMQAAGEEGLGVYLGFDLNLCLWDQRRDFARMMRRDLRRNRMVMDELLPAYRDHPALRGVYISNEPDRDNVATAERADALRGFLGEMYAMVKTACGLPVFCSPFFSMSLDPAELAAWWDGFVDRPLFDIIAMQDGVGCRYREIDPEDIPPRYERLAPVLAGKGIRFWNNVETFVLHQLGEPLGPAPLERIDRQYEAGRPFVERSITWEYGHFLGRQQVGEERYSEFCTWNRPDEQHRKR
jgi:hypothetical protein